MKRKKWKLSMICKNRWRNRLKIRTFHSESRIFWQLSWMVTGQSLKKNCYTKWDSKTSSLILRFKKRRFSACSSHFITSEHPTSTARFLTTDRTEKYGATGKAMSGSYLKVALSMESQDTSLSSSSFVLIRKMNINLSNTFWVSKSSSSLLLALLIMCWLWTPIIGVLTEMPDYIQKVFTILAKKLVPAQL